MSHIVVLEIPEEFLDTIASLSSTQSRIGSKMDFTVYFRLVHGCDRYEVILKIPNESKTFNNRFHWEVYDRKTAEKLLLWNQSGEIFTVYLDLPGQVPDQLYEDTYGPNDWDDDS